MFTHEMLTIIKLVAVTNILVAFCFLNNKILSDIYVRGLHKDVLGDIFWQ